VVVFDGETINLPHLVGEDYRLHEEMIAGRKRKSGHSGPPPALPAAAPTVRFSRIPKLKI